MKSSLLGLLALLFAVVALGQAVLPGVILNRTAQPATPENRRLPEWRPTSNSNEAEAEGSVTFKISKFSVTLGNRDPQPTPEELRHQQVQAYEAAARVREIERRQQIVHQFTISAICCSLVGLIFGPIAWVREKQPFLSGSAMGICCVAILWQYIVLGIVAGITIVVVILLLSALAS